MGFLHELWDETMAGPIPDSGLGSIRKVELSPENPESARRHVAVTRSISIVSTSKKSSLLCRISESPAPAEMASLDFDKSVTKKAASERERVPGRAEPRSPTVYDWIVISALDR